MKEILQVQHRKLSSPPFSFTGKHGRPEEPKVIFELIGKYQSECTLPHQSETPFMGERSFSNKQSVQGPVPERRYNSIPGINVPYSRDNFIPSITSVPERRNSAIQGINLG